MEDLILEGASRVARSALFLDQANEYAAGGSHMDTQHRELQALMGINNHALLSSSSSSGTLPSGSSSLSAPSNASPGSAEKWKSALWVKSSVEPALLRVPIVVVIFIFLWGLNLILLDRSKLQYNNALSIKNPPIPFALMWAMILLTLFLISISIFSKVLEYQLEYAMLFFYVAVIIIINIPFIPYQDTKYAFLKLLKNCLFPVEKVAFSEVLLADALTSLSKVMKDFGVTLISIFAVISNQNVVNIHNEAMILVALVASFPFYIRVRQCIVQLEGAQEFYSRLPILLNIGKYMTGFPPIWLTAVGSLGYFHPKLPLVTAVMAGINSTYSFMWDIIMDWGFILTNRDCRVWIRSKLHYSLIFYVIATIINLTLRFSWYANRLEYFKLMHSSQVILIVEIAEVFRRSMWNMFRIEWEVHTQIERTISRDKDDFEKLLSSK